jgi:hypothetical protein
MRLGAWSRKRVVVVGVTWLLIVLAGAAGIVGNRINRGINRYYLPKPGEPRHSTEDDTSTTELLGLLGLALLPPLGLVGAWLVVRRRRKDAPAGLSQADA